MPFVEFDVEAEIKRQCEKSPEFKRLWEERQKEGLSPKERYTEEELKEFYEN